MKTFKLELDDEVMEFKIIDEFKANSANYVVAVPVKTIEGMDADEAFAFEVVNGKYNLVDDEAKLDIIFSEYEQRNGF